MIAALYATATAALPLRVGVIGTGCIGIEHINNLHLVDNVQIAAIADSHQPSRQAAIDCLSTLGVENYEVHESYQPLLASSNVDAVVVCTPNDHHIHVLREAFRTGKHCLVEKPLCTEIAACAEAEALASAAVESARKAGTAPPVLWCGMEYRYIPTISRLLRDAHSGAIGDLRLLTIREHRFPFLRKVGDWNRFSERTGGTLTEKCCHHFDLMRLILRSEPVRFLATGGQDVNHKDEEYGGKRSNILDNAYVIIDFENGSRACLELCMFAEASKHQEEVRQTHLLSTILFSPDSRSTRFALFTHAFSPNVLLTPGSPPTSYRPIAKVSLVGSLGKLEAFAPSHGVREDDESVVNYRKGLRNPAFLTDWDKFDPPPPEECGELIEDHVGVDKRLLDAGNHCGATYFEVREATHARVGRL